MNRTQWARRPAPDLDRGATRVWNWELRSSGDLTASRVALRQELLGRPENVRADEDDVEAMLLTLEELASNGLRHGRCPVRVALSSTSSGWLVNVSDTAPTRCPTPAVDRDPALGGLGLHMVARVSSMHGWSVRKGRKHVWAFIPRANVA